MSIRSVLAMASLGLAVLVGGRAEAQSFASPLQGGRGGVQEAIPQPLTDVGIEDRPGAEIPLDVPFIQQDGRQVTLGDYLADGKPLVLVPAYYQCPSLCSLVLNGLQKGLDKLAWTAGKEFNVVTLSFDPRDTPELAKQKRAGYVEAYGRDVGERGWDFLVGKESDIRRVTDAIGFTYRWDEKQEEYAHASGAFIITPDGRLSRTLYGIAFPPRDMRLAISEASEGKLGSAFERVILFCFHYDPNAYGYVLASRRLMSAGGAVTVLVLGIFLLRNWRSENRRSRRPEEAHT